MNNLKLFIVLLTALGTLIGCRIPSLGEILTQEPTDQVLYCMDDPRPEHKYAIMTIFDKEKYEPGEEGYMAVLIKHSSRLKTEEASDRIGITTSPNIEILEAINSELLPYEPETDLYFTGPFAMNYHVPLDSEYRALIRFRFIELPNEFIEEYVYEDEEYSYFEIDYTQKVPVFGYGDFLSIDFINRELDLDRRNQLINFFSAEYCHPKYWNTVADNGTDLEPFYLNGAFPREVCIEMLEAETYEEMQAIKKAYLDSLNED